jgi:hypothetical protein
MFLFASSTLLHFKGKKMRQHSDTRGGEVTISRRSLTAPC